MDLMMPLPDKLVTQVRSEMMTRGFTLLRVPMSPDNLHPGRINKSILLSFHTKRWWKFPQWARYACWLERLLLDALPQESARLVSLELRQETAGCVDQEVDGWHADGSYIRSVFSPHGRSTLYLDDGIAHPVPAGMILLMTAAGRTRVRRVHCTLHRRPGLDPERAVTVGSFEPRSLEFDETATYHQATQSPRITKRRNVSSKSLSLRY
jgi:hypothetical protein